MAAQWSATAASPATRRWAWSTPVQCWLRCHLNWCDSYALVPRLAQVVERRVPTPLIVEGLDVVKQLFLATADRFKGLASPARTSFQWRRCRGSCRDGFCCTRFRSSAEGPGSPRVGRAEVVVMEQSVLGHLRRSAASSARIVRCRSLSSLPDTASRFFWLRGRSSDRRSVSSSGATSKKRRLTVRRAIDPRNIITVPTHNKIRVVPLSATSRHWRSSAPRALGCKPPRGWEDVDLLGGPWGLSAAYETAKVDAPVSATGRECRGTRSGTRLARSVLGEEYRCPPSET